MCRERCFSEESSRVLACSAGSFFFVRSIPHLIVLPGDKRFIEKQTLALTEDIQGILHEEQKIQNTRGRSRVKLSIDHLTGPTHSCHI